MLSRKDIGRLSPSAPRHLCNAGPSVLPALNRFVAESKGAFKSHLRISLLLENHKTNVIKVQDLPETALEKRPCQTYRGLPGENSVELKPVWSRLQWDARAKIKA